MGTITPNQREILAVQDELSQQPFYVEGDSSTGSMNVNVVNGGGGGGTQYAEGATTSPATGTVALGRYQSSPPTLISGELYAPQLDINGNLKVIQQGTVTISGTVTANAGTNLNTSLLALESGGNLDAIKINTDNLTSVALASNQTNGNQITQIAGSGGGLVTVTGGKLDVNATISGAGGGTSSIDKAAFTIGSDTGTPAMGIYQASLDTISTGDVAVVGLTNKRAMFVNLQNSSGTEIGIPTTPVQVSLANTGGNATSINAIVTQGTASNLKGVMQESDGSGNIRTYNSTTTTSKFGADANILSILGTAPTSAGKLDIKGADGDVFVRQTTGSNLHTVLDSGTLTSITNAVTVSQGTATNLKAQAENYQGGTAVGSGNPLQVTLANTGSNTNKLLVTPDANSSVNVAQVAGTTTSVNNGVVGNGSQRVTIASDSTGQIAPAANSTSTGSTIYFNSALLATKQAANANPGNVYGYHIYNPNSVVIFVQMFNLASGSVTVGSTAPTQVLAVPAGGWADEAFDVPLGYTTALTVAATTTATGSGAPTTGLLTNIFIK